MEVEYAKAAIDDILVRVTVTNRGPEAAPLHLLPTLWFRNTWAWEADAPRPRLRAEAAQPGWVSVRAEHPTLGTYHLYGEGAPELLFTENETNRRRLFDTENAERFVKDAFHEYVVGHHVGAVNPAREGTKAAAHYRLTLAPGESRPPFACASPTASPRVQPLGDEFEQVFARRRDEADAFYATVIPAGLDADARRGHASGPGGTPVVEAVVSLRRPALASGRSHPAGPSRRSAEAGATTRGPTSTTRTSSPCPTSGSIPGTPRGISPFTRSPSPSSIRTTPRISSSSSCASGTCTPTGRFPRTSGPSAT